MDANVLWGIQTHFCPFLCVNKFMCYFAIIRALGLADYEIHGALNV